MSAVPKYIVTVCGWYQEDSSSSPRWFERREVLFVGTEEDLFSSIEHYVDRMWRRSKRDLSGRFRREKDVIIDSIIIDKVTVTERVEFPKALLAKLNSPTGEGE